MVSVKNISLIVFFATRKYCTLFLFAILLANFGYGQQAYRDSLGRELNRIKSQQDFSSNDTIYINNLNQLAFELRFHNPDSLLILSKEALELSKSAKFKEGELLALLNLGDYHSDRGEHDIAIPYYKKTLSEAIKIEDTWLILSSENCIAGEYGYKGDYAKALKEYLKGLEIASKFNHKEMLSVINENIALMYADQNDFEEALSYLKVAKKLNEEIGDEVSRASSLSNMADVYADSGNYEYALFNANSSISILEKHSIMDWLAHAYSIKGKTYMKQKKYKWALYWYNQGKMLYDTSVQDERSELRLLQGMAETHLGIGKDSLAEHYAHKAFKMSSNLQVKEGVKNAAETLYKINKNKEDFVTALSFHELFQKLSDTLARNESKKSLLMLKTKMGHERQKDDLIAENEKALAKQKKYVTGILGVLLVLIVITFLVKRSEKIQKDLNKRLQSKKTQLEKNESELLEINQTKNKLFSIIGHDLRGPIGAFQGLLQLFQKGEINQTEFLSFIPKLRYDIDHISFTLNNLLSWGRTQMNGSVTKPTVVAVDNLVLDNINLLSEIASNKAIKVRSQVPVNVMTWSDADQIDIVIRNLISNALKFTPENGMVTINAKEKKDLWEISVRDTGVGIDKETKENIFAKNANVTTYGTNNEKGTGLGLMLCKEMVEKNHGTIWVDSTLNKGACFYFTLPKAKKEYEKAS